MIAAFVLKVVQAIQQIAISMIAVCALAMTQAVQAALIQMHITIIVLPM